MPCYKDYLEVFKSIGVLQFSHEDFEKNFHEKKQIFSSLPADSSIILKELFEFSLLGFYQAGGSGYGGSAYVFKYIDNRAQFNPSTKYKLHPGLTEVLGLKQYSKSS